MAQPLVGACTIEFRHVIGGAVCDILFDVERLAGMCWS